MRLLLLLAVVALAFLPKLVLWESVFDSTPRLIGPHNLLNTPDKLIVALGGVLAATFALLYTAARARA